MEKRPTEVTIYLADGTEREGTLFLSPFSSTRSGSQTLAEMLHEPEPFVPFIRNDKSFQLLNKKQISHLRYRPVDDAPEKIGNPIEVTITFINGKTLSGTTILETPEGKGRLIDFLNNNPGYFSLNCGDDEHYLVNPRVIVEIADQK
ncbi:MAG: hypothetical protein C0615_01925 [Desulfuromonas sp.]|nr:MAG: hypothetical protein C0615_01925 [Desulfuromonas sp.]